MSLGPFRLFQNDVNFHALKESMRILWDKIRLIESITDLAPPSDSTFLVGDGSKWVSESGATARASLGLGTIATQAADNVSITGGSITGITDLAVADGGTGASTAAAARTNLGAIGGSTGSTDNRIIRADGTGGATVQSGTSGPTYDDDGAMVNTAQPAFLAHNSATDSNQTGNGAVATVDFDTEIFDQGGDFASDIFTAPVTGRYLLISQVRMNAVSTGVVEIRMTTSNNTFVTEYEANPSEDFSYTITVIADMDANDTARVQVVGTGLAGNTMAILGGGLQTYFSGALLC